jgi:hypothetical protein
MRQACLPAGRKLEENRGVHSGSKNNMPRMNAFFIEQIIYVA